MSPHRPISFPPSVLESQEVLMAIVCPNKARTERDRHRHTVVNFGGPIRQQTSNSTSMNNPWGVYFYVSHLTKDPGDSQQWQDLSEY